VLPVDAASSKEEVGPDNLHGLQQASLVHVGLHLERRRLFANRSIEDKNEFRFLFGTGSSNREYYYRKRGPRCSPILYTIMLVTLKQCCGSGFIESGYGSGPSISSESGSGSNPDPGF
jgi:hypothetical protein